LIIKNPTKPTKRIMVGIPMTGLLRSEWVLARYGQVIPVNWSMIECIQWIDQYSPLDFMVADARNIIVDKCIKEDIEWLFFIDHDTMLPPGCILKWNERIKRGDVPVFGGLYFAKGVPSEPLLFRGRGNGCYTNWKIGQEVWCDGIPMGCTIIHSSILKVMWEESEEYDVGGIKLKRVFESPAKVWYDPEKLAWGGATGTEDLAWCTRIMEENILKKAGWPKYQRKKYPFLIDTSIFCRHIDWDGIQYPSRGEELQFIK